MPLVAAKVTFTPSMDDVVVSLPVQAPAGPKFRKSACTPEGNHITVLSLVMVTAVALVARDKQQYVMLPLRTGQRAPLTPMNNNTPAA